MTEVTTNFKSGKGGKKKPATRAERMHLNAVGQLRCVITGRYHPIRHHCFCDRIERYAGRKAPHFDVIPLWQGIHQGLIGHDDIAIHQNKAMWIELHGKDWEYIPAVYAEIYGNPDITHEEIEQYWKERT